MGDVPPPRPDIPIEDSLIRESGAAWPRLDELSLATIHSEGVARPREPVIYSVLGDGSSSIGTGGDVEGRRARHEPIGQQARSVWEEAKAEAFSRGTTRNVPTAQSGGQSDVRVYVQEAPPTTGSDSIRQAEENSTSETPDGCKPLWTFLRCCRGPVDINQELVSMLEECAREIVAVGSASIRYHVSEIVDLAGETESWTMAICLGILLGEIQAEEGESGAIRQHTQAWGSAAQVLSARLQDISEETIRTSARRATSSGSRMSGAKLGEIIRWEFGIGQRFLNISLREAIEQGVSAFLRKDSARLAAKASWTIQDVSALVTALVPYPHVKIHFPMNKVQAIVRAKDGAHCS